MVVFLLFKVAVGQVTVERVVVDGIAVEYIVDVLALGIVALGQCGVAVGFVHRYQYVLCHYKQQCDDRGIAHHAADLAYDVALVAVGLALHGGAQNLFVQLLKVSLGHGEKFLFCIVFFIHNSSSVYMIYFYTDGLIR